MPGGPTSGGSPRVPLAAPGCEGAPRSRRVVLERTCPPRAEDRRVTTSGVPRSQPPRCRRDDSSGSPNHRRVQGDAIRPGRTVCPHTRTALADEERPARGQRHQRRVPRSVPDAPLPRATRRPRCARRGDTNTHRVRDPDQTGARGGPVGRTRGPRATSRWITGGCFILPKSWRLWRRRQSSRPAPEWNAHSAGQLADDGLNILGRRNFG